MTVRLPVRPSTPQGNRCEKSYFIAGGASCSMKQSRTQSLLAFGTTGQHQGKLCGHQFIRLFGLAIPF